ISLATVTPSLVTRGAPNDLSSTTLRPLGPSVTLTALLRISTPRSMRSRASTPIFTSLADIDCFLGWFELLVLRSPLLAGVSQGERVHRAHPSRRRLCRLLRMREWQR